MRHLIMELANPKGSETAIARTPAQINKILDEFIKQPIEEGEPNIPLEILKAFDPTMTLENLQEQIKDVQKFYLNAYKEGNPDYNIEDDDTTEVEPMKEQTYDPNKVSPRVAYFNLKEEKMDTLDLLEAEVLGAKLVSQCRAVETSLLSQLSPQKLAIAILLYNKLSLIKEYHDGKYPDEMAEGLKAMLMKVDKLELSSTDDVFSDSLISHLVSIVLNEDESIKDWMKNIEKNGSRGLGSVIAKVHEYNGDLHPFFVPKSNVPEPHFTEKNGMPMIRYLFGSGDRLEAKATDEQAVNRKMGRIERAEHIIAEAQAEIAKASDVSEKVENAQEVIESAQQRIAAAKDDMKLVSGEKMPDLLLNFRGKIDELMKMISEQLTTEMFNTDPDKAKRLNSRSIMLQDLSEKTSGKSADEIKQIIEIAKIENSSWDETAFTGSKNNVAELIKEIADHLNAPTLSDSAKPTP